MLRSLCLVLAALLAVAKAQNVTRDQLDLQFYQLAILAENTSSYCAITEVDGVSGFVVRCNQIALPRVASFNIEAVGQNFTDAIVTGWPVQLNMRPGPPTPATVLDDGLLSAAYDLAPAPFSLETIPNVANLTVAFGPDGSDWLYITGVRNRSRVYCRVADYRHRYNGSTVVTSDVMMCDVKSVKAATRFKIQPVGWSWVVRRVMFRSVHSAMLCGSIFFQPRSLVTCNDGFDMENWKADMAVNFNKNPHMPEANGAEFMIQNWIEYPIPVSLWVTDYMNNVQAGHFLGDGSLPSAPPGDLPFFSAVKVNNGFPGSVIENGDIVMLKSSRNGMYCGVSGPQFRIRCETTAVEIMQAEDPDIYHFKYELMVPHM